MSRKATGERKTTGGAYVSRGKAIMRIATAAGVRTSKALPWVTAEQLEVHGKADPCTCAACHRAREIQALVNRLRAAERPDFVASVVTVGAGADEAKMVELRAAVAGIVGGALVKATAAPAPKGARDLDTLTERWLSYQTSMVDASYLRTLGQYAERWPDLLGVDTIDAIGKPEISGFVSRRLGSVLVTTVRKELSALRTFLTWAHEVAQLIDTVPEFPRISRKAVGVRSGRQRAKAVELTREQVEAVLTKLAGIHEGRAVARYTFMAETGLRPETIDKLEAPKHWQAGASEVFVSGDIDKARWERVVPISEDARDALAAAPARDDGCIFGPQRFVDDFKAAAKAAGLPKECSPYDLRHAWGTHAVDAGGNLNGVAYALGHKQVTTTNRYSHGSRRAAVDAVEAFTRSRRSHEGGGTSGCTSSPEGASGVPSTGTFLNDSESVRRRGLEPLQVLPHWNLNRNRDLASTNVRDVTGATGDTPEHSKPVQPPPAATSADDELRLLVSELRGMIADLRVENRALREQLGEKRAAPVVDLATRRR